MLCQTYIPSARCRTHVLVRLTLIWNRRLGIRLIILLDPRQFGGMATLDVHRYNNVAAVQRQYTVCVRRCPRTKVIHQV